MGGVGGLVMMGERGVCVGGGGLFLYVSYVAAPLLRKSLNWPRLVFVQRDPVKPFNI